MVEQRNIKYATDLCTFYNPAYWGGTGSMDDIASLFSWGTVTPQSFWLRVLEDVQAAGLSGIELTFAPGNFRSALDAFGTADQFAAEVAGRELEICSGFLSNRSRDGHMLDITRRDDQPELIEIVAEYAQFLHACNCSIMVATLPLRRDRSAEPPLFVDLGTAETACDGLHQAAAVAAKYGASLALHPEAFTMFRNSRDVDLFMTLLDPTYVNLCPDTAQFTVAGSDPVAIAERHKDRVVLTHWKDATGPSPEGVQIDDTIYARQVQWFAPVGRGVVDWPAWMRLMRDIRYQGWAIFELDAATDPVSELIGIRSFLENSLGHIYR
jgi:sugar phosphate isomerase/epimerase